MIKLKSKRIPEVGSLEYEKIRSDALKSCGGLCEDCSENRHNKPAVTYKGRCILNPIFRTRKEKVRHGSITVEESVTYVNMICWKCGLENDKRRVTRYRSRGKKVPKNQLRLL